MIGRLSGVLLEKQPPHILLDVQGVGYELDAPLSTFYQLPALGEKVTLHTHMVVREDAQLLYAFSDKRGRDLFRELIRLNGVGPKLALAILSGMDQEAFIRCVMEDDIKALTKELSLPISHSRDVIEAGLGEPSPWKCRAGARYLYIDEFSQARYCAQAQDLWSMPIDEVTEEVLEQNFATSKPCAERCTLGCVRDASQYDRWRPQRGE